MRKGTFIGLLAGAVLALSAFCASADVINIDDSLHKGMYASKWDVNLSYADLVSHDPQPADMPMVHEVVAMAGKGIKMPVCMATAPLCADENQRAYLRIGLGRTLHIYT